MVNKEHNHYDAGWLHDDACSVVFTIYKYEFAVNNQIRKKTNNSFYPNSNEAEEEIPREFQSRNRFLASRKKSRIVLIVQPGDLLLFSW